MKQYLFWFATLLGVYIVYPYLDVLTFSIIFATLFYPVHARMKKWVGNSISAFLITFFVLLLIVLPSLYLLQFAIKQSLDAYAMLQGEGYLQRLPEFVAEITKYEQTVSLKDIILRGGEETVRFSTRLLFALPRMIIKLMLLTFLLYFILRDGEKLEKFAKKNTGKTGKVLIKKARQNLSAVIFGNILTNVYFGVVSAGIFYLLDIPYAIILGILVSIFAIMPILGPWMFFFPLSFILYQQGNILVAILIFIWGFFISTSADLVLRTKFVNNIHPAIFSLGFLGGLSIFGLSGMFIGPVILSLVIAVYHTIKIL